MIQSNIYQRLFKQSPRSHKEKPILSQLKSIKMWNVELRVLQEVRMIGLSEGTRLNPTNGHGRCDHVTIVLQIFKVFAGCTVY